MKMQKILIAVLAFLFFSACGKKKQAVNGSPSRTETSAPAPTLATSADENAQAEIARSEAARIEAEKKAKEGRGSVNRERTGRSKGKRIGNRPEASKPTAQESVHSGVGSSSNTGSSGISRDQGAASAQDLLLTGGSSADGFIFTGSAEDSIITQLLAEENIKLAAEQRRNLTLATSIWDIAYLIDNKGQLTIDIEFKKGSGISKIQAETPYAAGKVMNIVANGGTSAEIQISAECLDLSVHAHRCSNLLVRFAQNGARATAVVRQTLANIFFKYEKVTEADEYTTLVEFFKNAKLDAEISNKIDLAYLHTFEVVKGKSGFKAVVTGKKGQIIGFSADLVLKTNFSAPNIAVQKETQFKDIDLWMGRIAGGKDLGFSDAISGAKLVSNNTKGELTIDMAVNSASTGLKREFTLKFTRVAVGAHL